MPLDYDDDDFYARDEHKPLLWLLWVAVVCLILWGLSALARAQDFGNVAGKVPVEVERPVQIGANVRFPVDPLEVLSQQSIDWLCGYVAILSSARSTPSSPVYVPGQKAMRCVENTAPPESPGGTLPPPPPPIVNARVTYAAGVVTIEAASQFTKAELLIDGRTSMPWYYGSRTLVDGRATYTLRPEALDGAEHLLDVRLYTAAMDKPHRPDGYPVRVVLTP